MKTLDKNGQEGFVLVFGLMIMALLTIIGLAVTSTTIFELKIAGNDKVSKELFYGAEASALEAAQRLENETLDDNLKADRTSHLWLFGGAAKSVFITDSTQWDDTELGSGMTTSYINAGVVALDYGVAAGKNASSLKMTESKVYQFGVLGHSEKDNGEKTIEIGYRKRY